MGKVLLVLLLFCSLTCHDRNARMRFLSSITRSIAKLLANRVVRNRKTSTHSFQFHGHNPQGRASVLALTHPEIVIGNYRMSCRNEKSGWKAGSFHDVRSSHPQSRLRQQSLSARAPTGTLQPRPYGEGHNGDTALLGRAARGHCTFESYRLHLHRCSVPGSGAVSPVQVRSADAKLAVAAVISVMCNVSVPSGISTPNSPTYHQRFGEPWLNRIIVVTLIRIRRAQESSEPL